MSWCTKVRKLLRYFSYLIIHPSDRRYENIQGHRSQVSSRFHRLLILAHLSFTGGLGPIQDSRPLASNRLPRGLLPPASPMWSAMWSMRETPTPAILPTDSPVLRYICFLMHIVIRIDAILDDQKTEPAPDSEHPKHWYGDESNKKKLEVGRISLVNCVLTKRSTDRRWHRSWCSPPRWWFICLQETWTTQRGGTHQIYCLTIQLTLVKGKARVWARNNWLEEARDRTKAFYNQGPQGPAVWILTQGKTIPNGAIAAGEEHGHKLYSSRAFHEVRLLGICHVLLLPSTCRVLSVSFPFKNSAFTLNTFSGWESFPRIRERLPNRIRWQWNCR